LINAKEAILKKSVSKGIIDITSYVENDNLFFEIKDNGGGIDNEILPKIFEPYFSTKEIKHGVGLSLYTSKIIANIHLHGQISATNYDNGALFKISIPIN
jgi:C4-dicarboxylate-specific signal transduction histidine kinase